MKLKITGISILLVCFLFFGVGVFARVSLPDAGRTPESSFYKFEILFDRITVFFQFSNAGKARRHMELSGQRLAEAHILAGKNIEGSQTAITHYTLEIHSAQVTAETSNDQARLIDLSTLVVDHLPYLDDISENTPFEKKDFVIQAKEFAIEDAIAALEKLYAIAPQQALKILEQGMQSRIERINEVAGDEENNVEAFLEYEQYGLFAKKLITASKEADPSDTTTERELQQATAANLAILQSAEKKIRPKVQQELERAMNAARDIQGLPLVSLREDINNPGVIIEEPMPTPSPQPTTKPNPTATAKPTPSRTPQPLPTKLPTATPKSSITPKPTIKPSSTPKPMATPTLFPSPIATVNPTSTPVPTPVPTPTPTFTPTPTPTTSVVPPPPPPPPPM